MKTQARITAAVLALAAGAATPTCAQTRQLAHVGTLKSVAVDKRAFVLDGPDGKSLDLTLDEGATISPVKKPEKIQLDKLADYIGKPASAILTSATTARALFIAETLSEPETLSVTFVAREAQAVQFRGNDGYVLRHKPAVNMLVVDEKGKRESEASWDWFEAHRGQPLTVRTIALPGMTYMWSAEVVTQKASSAAETPESTPADK